MKPHRILKDFSGSHHGTDNAIFKEGEDKHLSDSLAAIVVPLGWAEVIDGDNPADNRDTKVIGPEEYKPLKPSRRK